MLQNRTDLSANSDGYALHIATFYSSRLNKKLLEAALSAFLFGVLNLLTGAAIYCLIRRGMHNLAPKLLIGCALLLYLSTSMYWASIMQSIAGDNAFLDLATKTLVSDSVLPSSMSRTVALQKNNLVINIALIINNIIGDAIVWWRVWIIWRQSPVRYVGPILISATLALAIAANLPGSTTTLRGGYYVVNVWDLLAAASSFAMNAIAVSLIGYRTWRHKQRLSQNKNLKNSSHALRVLMLLVESGSVYCAICGLVVVFVGISLTHTNALTSPFMNTVAHIYYGCLGPLVAIYPMSIIVLVAVRKSRMENSLHNHLPDYNVDITIMLPQSAIGEKFGTSEGDLTYAPPISSIASEQTSQR